MIIDYALNSKQLKKQKHHTHLSTTNSNNLTNILAYD